MKINKKTLIDVLKVLLTITLATALSYAFLSYNFSEQNILLVYVVANIIVVLETRSLLYGVGSGLLCALVYEFFFISPRLSFAMSDMSYLLSIGFYIAVCIAINMMSYRLQAQIKKSEKSEQLVKSTYDNSKGLLKAKSNEEIALYEVELLKSVIKKRICICLKKRKNYICYGDEFIDVDANVDIFNYSLSYDLICGHRGKKFTDLKYKIYPLKTPKSSFGVLVVDCKYGDLRKNEREYIKANITHLVLALEREKIQDQKEDVEGKIEAEDLKNILVLNMANKMLEPLNEINTECNSLIRKSDVADKEIIKSKASKIKEKNTALEKCIEYIFMVSRLGAGEEFLKTKKVFLNGIITDALNSFKNDYNGRKVNCELSEVKFNCDAELVQSAFTNIISNAFEHTKRGSTLNIRCFNVDNDVVVEFEDNGGGIPDDKMETLFEVDKEYNSKSQHRLGLSVCKKIIEANDGKLKVTNNDIGGLTVKITFKG